jgi:hypothetical protein
VGGIARPLAILRNQLNFDYENIFDFWLGEYGILDPSIHISIICASLDPFRVFGSI